MGGVCSSGTALAGETLVLMPKPPPPPDSPALAHEQHLISPGTAGRFSIAGCSTSDTSPFETEEHATPELKAACARIASLQARLAAEEKHGLLIVLQGFDGAGKDGVIREVIGAMNPAGVRVYNFKKPSGEEAAHDFLWRFHQQTPARGMVHVFDRSHYEEVIFPRVHDLESEEDLRARLESINDFERMLAREGIAVVKIFLHLSEEEQKERVRERLEHRDKHAEFGAPDVLEREHWDGYQHAFESMIRATSTSWAPWHVIPADIRWYSQTAAALLLVDALNELDPEYPGLDPEELKKAGIKAPKGAHIED